MPTGAGALPAVRDGRLRCASRLSLRGAPPPRRCERPRGGQAGVACLHALHVFCTVISHSGSARGRPRAPSQPFALQRGRERERHPPILPPTSPRGAAPCRNEQVRPRPARLPFAADHRPHLVIQCVAACRQQNTELPSPPGAGHTHAPPPSAPTRHPSRMSAPEKPPPDRPPARACAFASGAAPRARPLPPSPSPGPPPPSSPPRGRTRTLGWGSFVWNAPRPREK